MEFSALTAAIKKQIKASMKRIAEKLIRLNIEKTDRLDSKTAFNIWCSRYIAVQRNVRYYNLIPVDDVLFAELQSIMEDIFSRSVKNLSSSTEIDKPKYERYYLEKPATSKQIHYAKYLMNMVKNEPLPEKRYTMYEMNTIINDLKRQIKSA